MLRAIANCRRSSERSTCCPSTGTKAPTNPANKRDVTATSLEPPLGNGAYRIKEFVPGRSIVYERVKDYWGKDLPVNIGRDNFDELRFEYFRDTTVALEAFKGDQLDWRIENVAKNWATAYDFPAVLDKRVVKEEFPIRSQGIMQGFVLNTRRAKFSDPRVRRAFNLALDFEEMNKQFFFGAYKRIGSFFEGTELASSGLPTGLELEILETVRGQVPPEVFTTAIQEPRQRQSGSGPQQSARGDPAAARSRLRDPQPEARQRQDRRADDRRVPVRRARIRTVRAVLQADPGTARHRRHRAHHRRRAVRESRARLRFRHRRRIVGRIPVAGQRAARRTGARRPRISPARAISSASRTPRSTS